MTCGDRQNLFLLLAAGQLEPAETGELHAHLASGCPACAGAWAEAQAVFATVGLLADPVALPPRAKLKLMARVAAEADASAPNLRLNGRMVENDRRRQTASSWAATLFRTGVAAAVAAGVAIVVTHHLVTRKMADQQAELVQARVAEKDVQIQTLLTQLVQSQHRQQATFALLDGPALKLAQLDGKGQPAASAQLLLNTNTRQWTLLAAHLPPLPAERTYEFWYITPAGQKIRAGTFSADTAGAGSLTAQMPPDLSAVAVTAVTDEPAGGSDQPTGTIQLVGKL